MKNYGCIKKYISYLCIILLAAGMLCACSSDKNRIRGEVQDDGAYEDEPILIYYLTRDEDRIEGVPYEGVMTEQLLLESMSSEPSEPTLKAVLGHEVTLKSVTRNDRSLTLDFDSEYNTLPKNTEVLFRASLVRTLCQLIDVDSVLISVNSSPLADSKGIPYPGMSPENFVDGSRSDTNSYEKTTITLYFADVTGTYLVQEKRDIAFSSNVPVEKIILEALLAGPKVEEHNAVLSSDRLINSVTVKDGICYVDLTDPVLEIKSPVPEELSLYSIVNSLTELGYINKVQISIDGDTNRNFKSTISLMQPFERKQDMIRE